MRIFDEIEDVLHTYIVDKVARYTIIQQLLVTKIHDENTHRSGRKSTTPLEFQDYSVEAVADAEVTRRLNIALSQAAAHYNLYLPPDKRIDTRFRCPAEALRNATKILAPVNILGSKTQVIQAFYMKFAKSLYKWDLAQYFTPHEVIDLIVDVANPRPGEHVHDPACGSADFLISALRHAGSASESCVWGSDNSEQAVQISILNMVLNGDGKTQIKHEDSLKIYAPQSKQFSVVLCNPPFGTKIVERRYEVLRKFDMGHKWERGEGGTVVRTDVPRRNQQTGMLFAELCVRLANAGGRIGIILPNGYLGNRGIEYVALREWLLRHARVVAVVAFPRFTFKKSGADVSASAIFLERRKKALERARDSTGYRVFFGNIESVGWRVGDKKAIPLYLRDPMTGALVLDNENEPILDADFEAVLNEFLRSPATDCFSWTLEDRDVPQGAQSWSVDIEQIARLGDLNLDPKRHSFKFNDLRRQILQGNHFCVGDVLEIVPQARLRIDPAKLYKYVEIERVGVGEYDYTELRGWQLPSRARLAANRGDVFIPHIWSCAGKWFIAAGDCKDTIVTNGCTRLRLKEAMEESLPDLVLGLCSEAFSVQMRALATGSDGLAEIIDPDLLRIVLPKITNAPVQDRVARHLTPMLAGEAHFVKFAQSVIAEMPKFPTVAPRKQHWSLV